MLTLDKSQRLLIIFFFVRAYFWPNLAHNERIRIKLYFPCPRRESLFQTLTRYPSPFFCGKHAASNDENIAVFLEFAIPNSRKY